MDEQGLDLAPLAPDVDLAAARALFDERRRRRRRRRRILTSGVSVALVVALSAIGWAALVRDGGQVASTGSLPEKRPVAFEVVGVWATDVEHVGQLRAARSAPELAELWDAAGLPGEPVAIDFEEQVAVSITIPDDACPPELAGFARDGERITPRFEEPPGGCFLPLVARTFVVAIDRASVRPAFELQLPAQPDFGFDVQLLRVEL
jgi:hypothetical protein